MRAFAIFVMTMAMASVAIATQSKISVSEDPTGAKVATETRTQPVDGTVHDEVVVCTYGTHGTPTFQTITSFPGSGVRVVPNGTFCHSVVIANEVTATGTLYAWYDTNPPTARTCNNGTGAPCATGVPCCGSAFPIPPGSRQQMRPPLDIDVPANNSPDCGDIYLTCFGGTCAAQVMTQ